MTSHTQSPKPPTACRIGFYCERCREESAKGHERRDKLIAKLFPGSGMGPRFACPFGRGEVGAYIPPPPSRGLGDTVARVAKPIAAVLGIEGCGCEERQAALNDLVPYESDELTPPGQ